jgi:carbonic anhydrase/acetyltransferase-like protein (isoleucine patch superfamily)
MIIKYSEKSPEIHSTAFVAPNAAICGDVKIGKDTCISYGAQIIAEEGRIVIGNNCIILENAVIRSSNKHSVSIGNNTLIGPHAHIAGCSLGESVFVATGASILFGAKIGARSEVRINGVVHIRTFLPPETVVPINWIAVGNPAQIFPPSKHEQIWKIQKALDFPKFVYGYDRPGKGETIMPEITKRYSSIFRKHNDDEVIKIHDEI